MTSVHKTAAFANCSARARLVPERCVQIRPGDAAFGLSMALLSGDDIAEPQARLERLRLWVEAQTGRAPADIEVARANGAPVLRIPGIARSVSLAHSAGRMLVAMADAAVGVDLERVGPSREPPWNVLAPGEQAMLRAIDGGDARHLAFLRGWVVKEALVKARGTGFSEDPSSLSVSQSGQGAPLIHEHGTRVRVRFVEVGEIEHGSERFVWAAVVL